MSYRPAKIFKKNKRGEICLTPEYYAYLRNLVSVDYEEKKRWQNLGVNLTVPRQGRIECLGETYNFILTGLT